VTTPARVPFRTILVAVTLAYSLGVLLWALYEIRNVLMIVYVSGLLAIGCSPTVRWLERRRFSGKGKGRLPRWFAIFIIYAGMLAVVGLTLGLIIPPIVAQSADLYQNLPTYVDALQQKLVDYRLITHRYTWSEFLREVPAPTATFTTVVNAMTGAAGAVAAIVTALVLPYYLLLEATAVQSAFLKLFAAEGRPQVARITRDVTVKVSAWLLGQLTLSAIIGVTAGIGLWLIGVPYFYVLALIAAFGELIPVVGPILAAVPALAVALTVSPKVAIITGVYFVVQQFIENNFLVPAIMERQVGVSAVTVIVALLVGTELMGIVGALLSVPTAAIIQVLLHDYLERDSI
jgi:predicted PurR-regulated permease PerM